MALKSLGLVDPLYVTSQDGWDLPQSAQLVRILSDGTSEQNEVLQQGSWPFRQLTLGGVTDDVAELAILRGYNHSKESVLYTDPDDETLDVRVFDFAAAQTNNSVWQWRMVLVEVESGGS